MAKRTGKGSRHQRGASAIGRKATKHQEFVGQAEGERAEAELRKHERLQGKEDRQMVREMAAELEQVASLKGSGTLGRQPLRIPRSVDEAREIVREAPDAMREKARERLQKLPWSVQTAFHVAGSAAGVLVASLCLGLQIARDVVLLPFSVLRALRRREA